jgi:ABC-type dipeptide/oligopeptide/nickel transport system ATPase component
MVVMRYGRVVEAGTAAQIFRAAEHPYTRQLVEASRVSSTPVEVVDA